VCATSSDTARGNSFRAVDLYATAGSRALEGKSPAVTRMVTARCRYGKWICAMRDPQVVLSMMYSFIRNAPSSVLVQTGPDQGDDGRLQPFSPVEHYSRDGISTDRSSSCVSAGTRVSN